MCNPILIYSRGLRDVVRFIYGMIIIMLGLLMIAPFSYGAKTVRELEWSRTIAAADAVFEFRQRIDHNQARKEKCPECFVEVSCE